MQSIAIVPQWTYEKEARNSVFVGVKKTRHFLVCWMRQRASECVCVCGLGYLCVDNIPSNHENWVISSIGWDYQQLTIERRFTTFPQLSVAAFFSLLIIALTVAFFVVGTYRTLSLSAHIWSSTEINIFKINICGACSYKYLLRKQILPIWVMLQRPAKKDRRR